MGMLSFPYITHERESGTLPESHIFTPLVFGFIDFP